MSSADSPRSVRRQISPIAVGSFSRTASSSARISGEVGAVEVVPPLARLRRSTLSLGFLRVATVEVRFAFSSVDPDPTSRESPSQAPHRLDGLNELRGLEEARRRTCRDGCELHQSPVELGDSRSVGDPRMSEVPGQRAQPAQPKVPIFTSAVHGGSLNGTDVSEHS